MEGAATKRSPLGANFITRASVTVANSRTQKPSGTCTAEASVPGRSQYAVPLPTGMSVLVHEGGGSGGGRAASEGGPESGRLVVVAGGGASSEVEQPKTELAAASAEDTRRATDIELAGRTCLSYRVRAKTSGT